MGVMSGRELGGETNPESSGTVAGRQFQRKGNVLMSVFGSVLTVVPMQQIDPQVVANSNAPWLPAVRNIAGMLLMTMIVVVVIVLIIGLILAVGGKLASMSSAQSTGFMILVWGLIVAAALGSISGLVYWATSISLAPAASAAAAVVGSVLGFSA